ncbi:Brefeldin A-inhibited guanine nucleotide-exchange protein 1 [Forsythia ovata]|uniref:Brefeldin A-inhibited guanine nucleotide-exchange protein 1 n=1 Tax=Forsythia ovata TaxID=205694 RepID=A0ABD1VM76_9LAMI
MDSIDVPEVARSNNDTEKSSGLGITRDDSEDDNLQTAAYVVSRVKGHLAIQLLIIQVVTDLYKMHWRSLSVGTVDVLLEIYSSIALHSHQLNSETTLQLKLQRACTILEISDPPMVHFENESYQNYLNFLYDLLMNKPSVSTEKNIEGELISVCVEVLQMYLDCAGLRYITQKAASSPMVHWVLPLGSAKKEELAARTPLVLSVLQILASLERDLFRKHISQLFPPLVDLVRSEHSSREVQRILSNIFQSCIGPVIMQL